MSLTSNTGDVVGNEATFHIETFGNARGNGVIVLIDYTKGASDTLLLKTFFKNENVSSEYYQQVVINQTYQLEKFEIALDFSGKFRLPIPTARNEEYVKIQFNGLIDGSANIEFAIDQPYI